jgi:hypothetical protein
MGVGSTRWHYTVGDKFRPIERDQCIKPATAFISWREKPAVWFSTHPVWEPTACKLLVQPGGRYREMTREETAHYGRGLVRIGVAPEAAPYNWRAYRRLSGVAPRMASRLVQAGKAQGADPRQWYVSFDAVPAALWIAVEVWQEERWLPLSWEGQQFVLSHPGG